MPYKLLVENRGLFSYNGLHNPHALEYILDEWVYPSLEGSLLFVFDTQEQAEKYNTILTSYPGELIGIRLYECEVGEVYTRLNPAWPTLQGIETFWNRIRNNEPTGRSWMELPGCYATDKVKLTRKIW